MLIFFKGWNKQFNGEEKTNIPCRIPNMYVDVLLSGRWTVTPPLLKDVLCSELPSKGHSGIRRKKKKRVSSQHRNLTNPTWPGDQD